MTISKKEQEYLTKLGEFIVKIRKERGLKQYELSDQLDIDVRVLRRIEKGKTNVQVLFLFKLAEILDIPTESLITFNISSK